MEKRSWGVNFNRNNYARFVDFVIIYKIKARNFYGIFIILEHVDFIFRSSSHIFFLSFSYESTSTYFDALYCFFGPFLINSLSLGCDNTMVHFFACTKILFTNFLYTFISYISLTFFFLSMGVIAIGFLFTAFLFMNHNAFFILSWKLPHLYFFAVFKFVRLFFYLIII